MLLAAGLCVFLGKYLLNGGSWVSSAFNRHLYNSSGVLACGTVLDRDGDVLSAVENGERTYYETPMSAGRRFTQWGISRATSAPVP